MWKPMSAFRERDVCGESYRGGCTGIDEHFDYGVFFSSYESRALLSSRLLSRRSLSASIVVCFKERDDQGLRNNNDRILVKQVTACSRTKPIVLDGQFSVRDVARVVAEIVGRAPGNALNGTARWFVDFSGSPKPHFLGIIARLFRQTHAPRLTLFHPTAVYTEEAKTGFSFTKGFDKYIWVPGLCGRPDARKPWTYIFLLGFEGERSYETYCRFEPEHVMALIGRPGYKPNYVRVAKEKNRAFLDEARPEPILYANAGDAVATWRTLSKAIEKVKDEKNVCIVPLGTKPHALGGALAALAAEAVGVLYLMPRAWAFRDVVPGEYVWRYDLSF